MKKAPKIKYGIEIVKPWSKEMYNHNDKVADEIRGIIEQQWKDAYAEAKEDFEESLEVDQEGLLFCESSWDNGNQIMIDIQKAVTCYGYGPGTYIEDVTEDVEKELHNAAYWSLKEMAEELEIELTCQFVGLK
tara:strand:+ start:61 stop:459 length:399 start_codon:yes stop_codon:yes gene_type:complete